MSNKILHLSIGILIGAALVSGITLTRIDNIEESIQKKFDEKYQEYDSESLANAVAENLAYDIEYEVSKQLAGKTAHEEETTYESLYDSLFDTETPPSAEASDTGTVVVTRTGNKYHAPYCGFVHSKTDTTSMSVADARSQGYTPCSQCN